MQNNGTDKTVVETDSDDSIHLDMLKPEIIQLGSDEFSKFYPYKDVI